MAALEEEERERKQLKVKLERLLSARLTHRDEAVRLLDMQMLQVIKIHKPTIVISKHF
jgi:hypothetical protein